MSEHLEELQGTYSDMHKEVYGFRPRNVSEQDWGSEKWLQEAIRDLHPVLVETIAAEETREKSAILEFESRVSEIMELGATTRDTAIKWLMSAEDDEASVNVDYFSYKYGLPSGYITFTDSPEKSRCR